MRVEFDKKTGEVHITMSVNPKSSQLSSTGKTYLLGSDRLKTEIDGVEASVQVNVTRPAGAKKGRK